MRMLRTFSNSILACTALTAAVWLSSPAEAAGCSAGNGTCFVLAAGGNSGTNTTYSQSTNGASCACLPASTDTIILDSSSGQFTINTTLSVGSILADASGIGSNGSYTGVLTHSANAVTINGASNGNGKVSFSSGMTYSPTSTASSFLFAQSGTVTLTTAGKNFAAVSTTGTGTTLQGDNLSVTAFQNSPLTITTGTYNQGSFGSQSVTFVSTSAVNVRTIILGSFVKIGGNFTATSVLWNTSSTPGLTFTKNNANIEVVPSTASVQEGDFRGGGLAFNALIVDAQTTSSLLNITGANTFSSISVGSGWGLYIPASTVQAVSGNFTVNGTPSNPDLVSVNGVAAFGTLAVGGVCTVNYAAVVGVTGTGSCGTYLANNSYSLLYGTTGWNIKPPVVGIIGG